jgi:hypothetical protein
MLKRPGEFISPGNIKGLYTASDTYRSLQSFCNYKPSAISKHRLDAQSLFLADR